MSANHSPDSTAALTDSEVRALRCLAALMIPPSDEFGVPGADDETIFADILASAQALVREVKTGIAALAQVAGADFASLDAPARHASASEFRRRHPVCAAQFESLIVRCYYRDDRVMRAIGMEPRPPFPQGFQVEASDLSLLDPVIARGRLWRDAP